jgi:hypothetical protein
MSVLRRISGQVILVISGRGRMMYQSLAPESEGTISPKRSKPQGGHRSPHDAVTSLTNWLATNIQGWKRRQPRPGEGGGAGRNHPHAAAGAATLSQGERVELRLRRPTEHRLGTQAKTQSTAIRQPGTAGSASASCPRR